MKKLLYILSTALILAACGKDKPVEDKGPSLREQIVGSWHSMSLPVDGDIYISLDEGGTFELYQKIGDGRHHLYRGTWNIAEDILTGKYNDGEDWAAAYKVDIKDNVLSMTSNNSAAETSTYQRSEIPSEVKETCEVVVKSSFGILNSQPQYRWL